MTLLRAALISQFLFGLSWANTSTIFILNDLASIEECPGKLRYRVSSNISSTFAPYLKATATSEQECAYFCYAKLLFCFAARYDPLEKICEFTFQRNVRSCRSDPTELSMGPSQARLVYCLECEKTTSIAATLLPTVTFASAPGITPDSEDSTNETIIKSPMIVSTSLLKIVNHTTEPIVTESTTVFSTPTTVEDTTDSTTPITSSSSTSATTTTTDLTTTDRPEQDHLAPIVMNKPWVKSWILRQPYANCSQDMLKPCSHDIGRDCHIEEMQDGCYACKCPKKSPSKGCLGPFWQSNDERKDLIMKRKRCDSGKYAQSVLRFYRKIDVMKNFDDCVLTVQPYCGMQQDRMPRTKGECRYYCYMHIENMLKFIS